MFQCTCTYFSWIFCFPVILGIQFGILYVFPASYSHLPALDNEISTLEKEQNPGTLVKLTFIILVLETVRVDSSVGYSVS